VRRWTLLNFNFYRELSDWKFRSSNESTEETVRFTCTCHVSAYLMEQEKRHRPGNRFAVKSQLTADRVSFYPWDREVCLLSTSYTFSSVRTKTLSQETVQCYVRRYCRLQETCFERYRIIDEVVVGIYSKCRAVNSKRFCGNTQNTQGTEHMLHVRGNMLYVEYTGWPRK